MTEETNNEQSTAPAPTFAVGEHHIKDGKILGQFDSIEQVLDLAAGNFGKAPVEAEAPAEAPVEEPVEEKVEPTTLKIEATPEPEAQQEMTQERMTEIVSEFASNEGKLSEETYAELEGKGYSKDVVDTYIEGQVAKQQLNTMKVGEMVGGMEKAQSAMDWAAQNLPASEIEEINYALQTSPVTAQAAIIRDLISRSGGGVARTLQGNMPGSSPLEPFQSRDDFLAAMKDPRYRSSEGYRNEVMARRKSSKF